MRYNRRARASAAGTFTAMSAALGGLFSEIRSAVSVRNNGEKRQIPVHGRGFSRKRKYRRAAWRTMKPSAQRGACRQVFLRPGIRRRETSGGAGSSNRYRFGPGHGGL
ncbi:hypothetical protein B5F39_12980 [Cloacibacillus sp. An23]|nr:hypothetical protein B5F39_12980 [Cloacibacillus sp. An23]